MNRTDEWTLFLENLRTCATENHRVTPIGIGMLEKQKIEAIYRQGLRDCAWLLKNLGVLA